MAFAQAVGGGADALRAEIDVAGQLADDDHVDRPGDLGTERGGILEAREQLGGTQIGEQAEVLAQAENGLLGAELAFERIAVGIADRTEQDGICTAGEVERLGGQRMTGSLVRGAADEALFIGEVEAERIEHPPRFRGDFGSDAVAGQYRDQGHVRSSCAAPCRAVRAHATALLSRSTSRSRAANGSARRSTRISRARK